MQKKHFEFLAAKDTFKAPPDAKDPYVKYYKRSRFHRDRDRIIYSRSFRRLKGKSQVFLAGYDDHIRNRLTHTLEVSQLATSIAISLRLNLMLTEAIALGHDLGHTPFGHAGERVLNNIMNGKKFEEKEGFINVSVNKGFKHNWQSIRTVEYLESNSRHYPGLELSDSTKWGILNHTSLSFSNEEIPPFYVQHHKELIASGHFWWSFEGLIVAFADEIAQRHHDTEDGLIAGLIDRDELLTEFTDTFKDKELLGRFRPHKYYERALKNEKHKDYYVPLFTKYVTHFYVDIGTMLLIKNINHLCNKFGINKSGDLKKYKSAIAKDVTGKEQAIFNHHPDSKLFIEKDKKFKDFLKHRILYSYQAQQMDGRSEYIIENLFRAFITNPQHLSDSAIIGLFTAYEGKQFEFASLLKQRVPREKIVGDLRDRLREVESIARFKLCLQRVIADYIAGMTDDYATYLYEVLYGARELKNW
jgi:dGTPase